MQKRLARKTVASLALAALAMTGCMAAGENQGENSVVRAGALPDIVLPTEITDRLALQISRNPQRYLERMTGLAYQIDPNGSVTLESYRRYLQIQASQQRASIANRYLYADVSGDGVIQATELVNAKLFLQANQKAAFDIQMTDADTNADNSVTYQELIAHAGEQLKANMQRRGNRSANDLMLHDLNNDDVVTVSELRTSIQAIADNAPTAEEVQQRQRAQMHPPKPKCELPQASESAEIVILSGYEGNAVSTVAVGGQDRETSVATVVVEDGKAPLYIVAGAHDQIIWKLEGATDRVERFVAQPGRTNNGPGVGVVGLPEESVSFVPAGVCFNYFSSKDDGRAAIAKARIEATLGRQVDHLVARYGILGLRVPSDRQKEDLKQPTGPTIITRDGAEYVIEDGQYIKQTAQSMRRLNTDLRRFYPGGVINIDVGAVVSSGDVSVYEVLPQQAGLLQLVSAGKIEITPDGYFRIVEEIQRYPAGLSGSHSVKFLVAKGVPVPQGSPGHSTVLSEETGECISGVRCR